MSENLAHLAELVGVEPAEDWQEIIIRDLCDDSREVPKDAIFAAINGETTDGHTHARSAIQAGAKALLVERHTNLAVPELVVDSVRDCVGELAAAVHNCPSNKLTLVGVTGTNGKTTTVHILASVLRVLGEGVTEIGTLNGELTTPTAASLQRQLAEAVARQDTVVAMEVSSHGLEQGRLVGCRFKVAAFTNLSAEHLDYHGSIENYFAAKCRLFAPDITELAVINTSNEYGARLAAQAGVLAIQVGVDSAADVRYQRSKSTFRWRDQHVQLPLPGSFNVQNAVLAAEIAVALGYRANDIANALATTPTVPGRFELIDESQLFTVVIDYAHTHQALATTMQAAAALTDKALIVVFGAGGNRDRCKRPLMGKVVRQKADWVAVTSDNPRDERAEDIINDIVSGMTHPPDLIEIDRRQAIAAALKVANEGDLVLIAGKGHETTQQVGSCVWAFDDRVVARQELQKLKDCAA
ncbi:MAG: UDP-N-acetylmuramoyl-L-alanyl-D-glutamate--2,6-diaminopimelate ligase [Acidimicrobiia bacterium]|nr:UDP-N-acetylmuramoyl-L-alanyl-D-glutamate--2,6-diaminopimelate ligase [Acidimicrobiia bacterium]MCY4456394.1 UDP-N-acetylmuramoyl-L-alanyl-D-glutamate--2,6-diaminopimelate ligase [Acidimicrobiaceae bacterium]